MPQSAVHAEVHHCVPLAAPAPLIVRLATSKVPAVRVEPRAALLQEMPCSSVVTTPGRR